MNIRQRKKRAREINNWYKGKKIYEYDCPYCSWCALDDEEYRYHNIISQSFGHPEYYGYIEWDVEVTCPYCKTKFIYSDANM